MMTREELALAKAQLARIENARIEKRIGHLLRRNQPEETTHPLAPVDAPNRKYVRMIRRGCSGFQHRNFLTQ